MFGVLPFQHVTTRTPFSKTPSSRTRRVLSDTAYDPARCLLLWAPARRGSATGSEPVRTACPTATRPSVTDCVSVSSVATPPTPVGFQKASAKRLLSPVALRVSFIKAMLGKPTGVGAAASGGGGVTAVHTPDPDDTDTHSSGFRRQRNNCVALRHQSFVIDLLNYAPRGGERLSPVSGCLGSFACAPTARWHTE